MTDRQIDDLMDELQDKWRSYEILSKAVGEQEKALQALRDATSFWTKWANAIRSAPETPYKLQLREKLQTLADMAREKEAAWQPRK